MSLRKRYVQGDPEPGQRYAADPVTGEEGWVDPAGEGDLSASGATAANDIAATAGATTALKLANLCQNASETQEGVAELATAAEIVTGTDAGRVPNVANLKTALASDGMWLTKRTKMPDGATAVYSQDAWSDLSGVGFISATHSESNGEITITPTSSTSGSMTIDSVNLNNKHILLRVKRLSESANLLRVRAYNISTVESQYLYSGAISTSYQVLVFLIPAFANRIYIYADGTAGTVPIKVDFVWIGDYSYLAGSLSEEAARIADQLGDSAGTRTKAYSTLTSTGTAPADADTVTLGGKVYTFKTTLGTTEGQVLIGDTASAAAALDNLKLAINGDAGTFGVKHYCAAANPMVTATTNTDTTQVVEATATGLLGNQITTAESSTQLSWANPDGGTGYLSRGTDDVTQKILTSAANYIAGGGTRPAAAKVELTLTTLIGYETTVDVASGATFTLPSGGTWIWNVYGYGATISSAKRGSSAGGTTLTVAGANASVGYRRYA